MDDVLQAHLLKQEARKQKRRAYMRSYMRGARAAIRLKKQKEGKADAQYAALAVAAGGSAAAYDRNAVVQQHYRRKAGKVAGLALGHLPRAKKAAAAFRKMQEEGELPEFTHMVSHEKYRRINFANGADVDQFDPGCLVTITNMDSDLTDDQITSALKQTFPFGYSLSAYEIQRLLNDKTAVGKFAFPSKETAMDVCRRVKEARRSDDHPLITDWRPFYAHNPMQTKCVSLSGITVVKRMLEGVIKDDLSDNFIVFDGSGGPGSSEDSPYVINLLMWFDAIGPKTFFKIRLMDPGGFVIKSKLTPFHSLIAFVGKENLLKEYIGYALEELDNINEMNFPVTATLNGEKYHCFIRPVLFATVSDHLASAQTLGTKGGSSEYRDYNAEGSRAFAFGRVLFQTIARFTVGEVNRRYQRWKLANDLYESAGHNLSTAQLRKDKAANRAARRERFNANRYREFVERYDAVFNVEPHFAAVTLLHVSTCPPLMHNLVKIIQLVLSVLFTHIIRKNNPDHNRFVSLYENMIIVASKGEVAGSAGRFREIMTELLSIMYGRIRDSHVGDAFRAGFAELMVLEQLLQVHYYSPRPNNIYRRLLHRIVGAIIIMELFTADWYFCGGGGKKKPKVMQDRWRKAVVEEKYSDDVDSLSAGTENDYYAVSTRNIYCQDVAHSFVEYESIHLNDLTPPSFMLEEAAEQSFNIARKAEAVSHNAYDILNPIKMEIAQNKIKEISQHKSVRSGFKKLRIASVLNNFIGLCSCLASMHTEYHFTINRLLLRLWNIPAFRPICYFGARNIIIFQTTNGPDAMGAGVEDEQSKLWCNLHLTFMNKIAQGKNNQWIIDDVNAIPEQWKYDAERVHYSSFWFYKQSFKSNNNDNNNNVRCSCSRCRPSPPPSPPRIIPVTLICHCTDKRSITLEQSGLYLSERRCEKEYREEKQPNDMEQTDEDSGAASMRGRHRRQHPYPIPRLVDHFQLIDLTLHHWAALKYIRIRIARHFLRLQYPFMEQERIKMRTTILEAAETALLGKKGKTEEDRCRLGEIQRRIQMLEMDHQYVSIRHRNAAGRTVCYVRPIIEGEQRTEWELEGELWLGKFKAKEYSINEIRRKINLYAGWIRSKWSLVIYSMEAKEFINAYHDKQVISELGLKHISNEEQTNEETMSDNDEKNNDDEMDEENNDIDEVEKPKSKRSKPSVIEENGAALLTIQVIIRLIKKWKSWKEKLVPAERNNNSNKRKRAAAE